MTTMPPVPDGRGGGCEATPRQRVVWSLRTAIEVVARDGFGAGIVERRIPGFSGPYRDVEPIAGVRAAVLTRDVAVGRVREYARQARSGGHSWDAIAEAMGIEGGQGQWPRAQLAYLHLIEGRWLDGDSVVSWWCGCCGERVDDRGPFEAAPFNNETGHAAGCARHAAEVAAYRADRGQ